MADKFEKYGAMWDAGYKSLPLKIELEAIRLGGKWRNSAGKECGIGTFEHMMNARKLLWPKRYRHRWTDLIYQNIIDNDVTILMGAASTGKTATGTEYAVIRYFSSPRNTLCILSTITMDKLDIGVYASLLELWSDARKIHPWLPGHSVAYKKAITTDDIDEDEVRLFTRGIICRPARIGSRFVGLGALAGVKQENIIYLTDELQFMESFSKVWPHLFSNGNVKIIGSGNPKHDPEDELSIAAEPKEGWAAMPEPEKTTVWETKFMRAKCVNLVGTDSPNFDVPDGQPEPYKRLIGRSFVSRIAHDSGRDSFEFYQLCKGVMKVAFAKDRVISRQLCREHGALDGVTWVDATQFKGYAIDPSYGGDDRCVGMPWKLGMDVNGLQVLHLGAYKIFKINLQLTAEVESQIAQELERELEIYDINPEDVFYDANGKGTIGGAFAEKFGKRVPVPVDSGDRPSRRPVRNDLKITEENGNIRLKRCDEHYSKFVSEMWFSARYAIMANQLKGLSEEAMAEGCARIYTKVAGNRIEVEPKNDPKNKDNLKRRLGKSPDLFDCVAIAVEGARQRGFSIAELGQEVSSSKREEDFFDKEAKEYQNLIDENLLQK
jgi:hypothetical protein